MYIQLANDGEFDPKKAKSNRQKHGVIFEEAETSLLDPYALVQENPDANNEARFVLIGKVDPHCPDTIYLV